MVHSTRIHVNTTAQWIPKFINRLFFILLASISLITSLALGGCITRSVHLIIDNRFPIDIYFS